MYEEIVKYLTPVLGDVTAANLVRHYCARMRLSADEIDPSNLQQLADGMRPMLAVWLGSAGAARMAEQLGQLRKGAAAK
jgi:hypothetical protein